MLDQDTKRKIDSARQSLVGKVPDPKAQVEQITTALIYKIMHETDKKSQELDGEASYFVDSYKKYAWSEIMDTKLGDQARLNLYFEALSNLGNNPHTPKIFRDIFGDRALPPYRDARTLTLFLKEIDGFNLNHSEDLGDAYEFLLNVIGTSGEAGQFRTPRHLIDFIVEVIDPNKNATILDPACGTAGFLISAYKHILKQHDGLDGTKKQKKQLTPDEKEKLINNFVGYDIDPGMVRIATVNMYLHKFSIPKIFEYDTLTYEERWNDNFDVILANPPFMTPKGGMRPHNRFSIQANRAEVLFVDYIADHLNINGKAAIIVPEGIVFNKQKAYRNLRKKLVNDFLIAVVSLPQGVFMKPGGKGNVKTSVLIFDKALIKKTTDVLFVSISNDGFDRGVQKHAIDKNDLPLALEVIKKYKVALECGKKFKLNEKENKIAHIVSKEKIAKTGEYHLIGERYKESVVQINQKWPMVELNEVCDIQKGTSITKAKVTEGKIPVIAGGQQPAYYHSVSNREGKTITISASGAYAGFVNYFDCPIFASDCTTIKTKTGKNVLIDFVFYLLKTKQKEIYKLQNGAGQPHVYGKNLAKIKIPLPSIAIQKEIIERIEAMQDAINHAKAIIQSLEREREYFGETLRKLKNIKWVELEKICEINPKKSEVKEKDIEVSFVPMQDIRKQNYYFEPKQIKKLNKVYEGYRYFANNDVLLAKITPCFENGKSAIAKKLKNGVGFGSTEFIVFRANNKTIPEWIYNFVANRQFINEGKKHMTGSAGQRRLSIDFVRKCEIPLPSLEIQKKLVSEAEKEQQIINANKELIKIMEQKILNVLSEI